MKFKALFATVALAALAVTAAVAAPAGSSDQPGAALVAGPMSAAQGDSDFGADMGVVHELLADHNKIKRTVTKLLDGIRTVTESDDPQVAQEIKAHVASMDQRLKDGKVFNVASHSLPTIFANKEKIHTEIQQTSTGVIVTQTSSDSATVAALQAHAGEVTDLAREGAVALMRSMMANGGPMDNGGPGHGPMTQGGQMGMGMMAQGGMMYGGGPMMAQMMQHMMRGGGPMGEMQHAFTPSMKQGLGASPAAPPAQTTR